MLLLMAGIYTAHVRGMEAFMPMPDYHPSTMASETGPPRVVEQLGSHDRDHTVTYTGESRRMIGVWQNSVETILALGVGDRIIGAIGIPDGKYIAPEYRDAYEAIPYKSMEIPDMETTLLWEPDLLVGWYSTFQRANWRSTDFWESRGVHTYIARASYPKSQRTLEGEYQYILELGQIVNRESRAQELVKRTSDYVASAKAYGLSQRTTDRALIVERMGKQLRVYDEHTLAGNMLQSVGGHLIPEAGTSISTEELIDMNPDVLFLVVVEDDYDRIDQLVNQFYENPLLQHVNAVKHRRIYGLPLYMVYSAGTRVHDGLTVMIQGLYPQWKGDRDGQ